MVNAEPARVVVGRDRGSRVVPTLSKRRQTWQRSALRAEKGRAADRYVHQISNSRNPAIAESVIVVVFVVLTDASVRMHVQMRVTKTYNPRGKQQAISTTDLLRDGTRNAMAWISMNSICGLCVSPTVVSY